MAKAIQKRREYVKSDDLMLEQAQTMRNLFEGDKADFTALYIPLEDPFSANFQTAIDTAQDLPTADEEALELKVLTEDVLAAMENCRVQFMLLASYVKLLFPNSIAKQDLFGLKKYDKVRSSQTKMYDLMQLAYRKANSLDYKADLIALGFVQTEIDKLETYGEALYDANEAQEDLKQQIRLRTEQRVTAYNAVWEYMKKISAASKQVYADNYTKQQMYLLYPEGEGGRPGKIQGLEYDLPTHTASWLLNMASDTYQLEYKYDDEVSEWETAYDGTATEAVHDPGEGDWLYRVRGVNDKGPGEWSDELSVSISPA